MPKVINCQLEFGKCRYAAGTLDREKREATICTSTPQGLRGGIASFPSPQRLSLAVLALQAQMLARGEKAWERG